MYNIDPQAMGKVDKYQKSSFFQSKTGGKRVNKEVQLQIIKNFLNEKTNKYSIKMPQILEEV